MKVLTTSLEEQTLKIIPRFYVLGNDSATLELRDDTTNKVTTYILSPSKLKDFLIITQAFNLVEGHFYDFKVYLGIENLTDLDIIYKGKIFCTDQNINQSINDLYTVNKNEYVSQSSNNDYIVL